MCGDVVTGPESRRAGALASLTASVVAAGVALTLTLPGAAMATDDAATTGPTASPTAGPSATAEPTGSPSPTSSPSPTGSPSPTVSPTPTPSTSASPEPSASVSPSATPSAPADGAVAITGAEFAWSMNQQSNARSHNPMAINHFGAGETGASLSYGEWLVTDKSWRATSGNVRIEKASRAGQWRTATWAGLQTDAAGKTIQSEGPFSGHRVRLVKGKGTVDPQAEDARISWTGTWSVVYYSGNSVFTVTDPVLEVEAGAGVLTAELGGWAGARDDLSVREKVAPRRVVIATLRGVDVTAKGVDVTPRYDRVKVSGTVPQRTDEAGWGSFPQEMIAFLGPLGIDQFWYSTGLRADWTKKPAAISVAYAGGDVSSEVPPVPTEKPAPINPVTQRPTAPLLTPPSVPAQVPVPALPPETSAALAPVSPVDSGAAQHRLAAAPVAARAADPTGWWIGSVLLLAASGLLLFPSPRRRTPA